MTSMRFVVAACAIFALMACHESQANDNEQATAATSAAVQPGAPSQAAVPAGAPSGKAGRYSVVATPVTIRAGGKTTTKLTIQPAKGLKFNKDFPSKFIVNAGRHAKCDKKDLTKRAGDVKMDGKTGVVTIPLSAVAVGTGDLSIIGNFSVCNDEQCFVLRGESLALSVTVK